MSGTDHTPFGVMTTAACGFTAYYLLDRLSALLFGAHGRHLGPGSLSMHSLIDGLGIGLAHHLSVATGIVVAIAILAHDFLDGADTLTLSLSGGTGVAIAHRWLAVDALAPIAGGFLYIGASQTLPRSRGAAGSGLGQVLVTICGMTFVYAVLRVASS